VLQVGEMADPSPGPGEVRVRVTVSGINPGDYATRDPRPDFDFWSMLANVTIRLLGSDDFPSAAKHHAAAELTVAAREGALRIPIDDPLPLDRIAEAHDRVDAGTRRRVVLAMPQEP
jgi:NADPH2:quinone reductase